jgi:hypothetical protein
MSALPQTYGRPVVLVDIDGTLADVTHRVHHVRGAGKKDWHRFFQAMHQDEPNQVVMDWVKNLAPEYEVIVVSGRPDNYRKVTERWLAEHGIEYSALYMRRAQDRRPDDIVKREILHKQIGKDRVAFVIDDRASVCRMWRSEGLRTFQVAEGNF